ncbi:DMT family transporter [Paenibacillus sp. ISL-20]|uniref:DMT family transporter n=1 Tax=Paenibacillus sp. ISL-20 TaxID=2819163 RepID=UPI001BEB90EE|nr:DMT family transporter [Paenibacillus sp. ISL-20]MBT2763616.1 DMT family transporter [Paenibacillus sp. ISL-20]
MNTSNTSRAYAAALGYTVIIGFSFMFVKLALIVANPLDTLAHRFTISFIVASLALLMARRKVKLDLKRLLTIVPLAIFYPFLFFTLQTFGLVYTSSAEAGIIHATVPIFTLLLASLFLKERSSWAQKLFTVLSVTGIISIFVLKGVSFETSSTLGIVLILLSALSNAIYSVMARKLTQKQSVLDITFIMSMIGFVLFNLMSAAQHAAQGTLVHYFDPFLHPSFVWAVLYLGVLSSLGTSLLSNYALSQMEASRMGIFNNLATVVTIFGGVAFLNEDLAYYHVIGAALVIIGVIGNSLAGRSKSARRKPLGRNESKPA